MATTFIIRHSLPFMEKGTVLAVTTTSRAMYALARPYAYRSITLCKVRHYKEIQYKTQVQNTFSFRPSQGNLSLTRVRYLKLLLSSPDSDTYPTASTMGMVQLALQRKSQIEGRPVAERVLPYISVTTTCLRSILLSICTQIKHTIARSTILERRQWVQNRGVEHARLFDAVPFCRVKHLTIAPFEFPALGATGLRSMIGAFESVRRLELHVTSGTISSKVWMANLLEIREQAPFITDLILVFCDHSIFQAEYVDLTALPFWTNLVSLDIHLKNKYINRERGREWQFNKEPGRLWTSRIISQIRKLLDSGFDHMTGPGSQKYLGISNLTLHFPAHSTFLWNPNEVVEAFETSQEANEVHVFKKLNVFIRYNEAPATPEASDIPEETEELQDPEGFEGTGAVAEAEIIDEQAIPDQVFTPV